MEPNMEKEEILTIQEVSTFLKSHPDTIYKLARKGEIPSLRVGKNWRFRKKSLEAWLEQQEQLKPAVSL